MSHIIFKQPNELFCILSTVTNCPIKWNLTKQELISYEMLQEKEISKEKLKNCDFKSFDLIDVYFIENPLMTRKNFEFVKEECSKKPDYKNPDFYVEDISLPYLLKIKNKYELQLRKSKIKLKYNEPATKETADLKNKIRYCETMLGIISWFLAFNYETDEQAG